LVNHFQAVAQTEIPELIPHNRPGFLTEEGMKKYTNLHGSATSRLENGHVRKLAFALLVLISMCEDSALSMMLIFPDLTSFSLSITFYLFSTGFHQ